MPSNPQQIHVPNTLDVEAIERTLADLWKQSAGHDQAVVDDAMLRARVAGLMVFLHDESLLSDTQQVIGELSSFHPCRALLMAGDRNAPARDIEMYVSAFCGSQKRSNAGNLCCEEITLSAQGHFVSELPSAAVPLLVPDLPVFLWWRAQIGAEDKVFSQLCLAADRVVIDSADFQDPASDLVAVAQLFKRDDEAMVLSDLNWARLTPWRASLANFYDVEDYRADLDRITHVGISFVAETVKPSTISSQALLIAGWLASRLEWRFAGTTEAQPKGLAFQFEKNDRLIKISINEVQRPAMKSGRLCEIELRCSDGAATFLVSRSEDGLHLETKTTIGARSYPGRLLPVANWSAAQLLSREMEILGSDKIYEQAIEVAPEMLRNRER